MDNRVINDLKEWQQMEKQWKELLGPEVVKQRAFMIERLRHLKAIPKKYTGQDLMLTKEEKTALKLVKGEINRMEKYLYPNPVVRTLVKAFDAIKEAIDLYKQQKKTPSEWKPSLFPKVDKRVPDKEARQDQNVVSIKKSRSMENQIKNKGPDRDMRATKGNDDEPLLGKLRNGRGQGLKK